VTLENNSYYHNDRGELLKFIPLKTKSILDIGCGAGNFAYKAKKLTGAYTTGIEINKTSAKEAVKKIDKVYVGNIEKIIKKLPNNKYDVIFFNDVLEHLIYPNIVLNVIKTKLKKTGIIICSLPNIRNFKTLIEIIINKDFQYKSDGVLDKTHLRFYTKKSMVRMIEEAGYKILTIEGLCKSKNFILQIVNILFLNYFDDSKYTQYIIKAKQ